MLVVVDFGSQYTQLIARRLREMHVRCDVVSPHGTVTSDGVEGILLSGGPATVTGEEQPIPPWVLEAGCPILGICYGHQALCRVFGGQVETSPQREFGKAELSVTEDCDLFHGVWSMDSRPMVLMSHGDRVMSLPHGFVSVAYTAHSPYACVEHKEKRIYGLQFHPEVVHTEDGSALLQRFAHMCGCARSWTMPSIRKKAVADIREKVGDQKVVCALSGGVDSAVTAWLVHEAIGEQLTCLFVDHGLLRQGEAEDVVRMFQQLPDLSLRVVPCAQEFLTALSGVVEPEMKRKIIGGLFISCFEREAEKLGKVPFLAQGTIYSDVIESAAGHQTAHTIKSHHNVGGLPETMTFELLEPLRHLFKDEVRALGQEIGMPPSFLKRHPFPGPGLAIRILGSVTQEKCDSLRQADAIFLEEIKREGLYDSLWQAFAVLLSDRTVGVMGDRRTYEHVCALRAVVSHDGMTATTYPFEHAFLSRVADRIVNEGMGINRVVYDHTSKPPGTIEWE